MEFRVPVDEQQGLAEELAHVVLPERLSAVWHGDLRALEVIWTRRELPPLWKDVLDREFNFDFSGTQHRCHFGKSSERVLTIAKYTRSAGYTNSEHRNLESYWLFNQLDPKVHDVFSLGVPRSFWVENVDYDEENTLRLIYHLDFYLRYYDFRGPYAVIHSPTLDKKVAERTRFIHGKFPPTIESENLDATLLTFWLAAVAADVLTAFLLYFRIIEYAANVYIDQEAKAKVRKLLETPHRKGMIDSVVTELVKIVGSSKMGDDAKIRFVICDCVDPELIWKDIKANADLFLKPTVFDGGHEAPALIAKGDSEGSFCDHGLGAFADAIRGIRNTLSHGRDPRTGAVITPTRENVQRLRPWLHLIATAAGEVVLRSHVS